MPTTTYIIRFAPAPLRTALPTRNRSTPPSLPLGNPSGFSPSQTALKCTPQIELVEYSYAEDTERLIARIEFGS